MALHGSPDPFVARVYLAAAKVGGIWANDRYPAEFIYQNLMIEANVIHAPRFLAGAQLQCRASRGLDRSCAEVIVGPSKTTVGPNLARSPVCMTWPRTPGRALLVSCT